MFVNRTSMQVSGRTIAAVNNYITTDAVSLPARESDSAQQ